MKKKTHCVHGHKWTLESTYVNPKGHRICRTCKRDRYQKHYEQDSEASRERNKKWKQDNPEKHREINRKWRLANPDKCRAYVSKRIARKRNAEQGFKPWMERYFRYQQEQRCWYCGETMLQDVPRIDPRKENLEHKLPLSRGGAHNWINTVLACRECNQRKGTKTEEEFN